MEYEICLRCGGRGDIRDGETRITCPDCQGQGAIEKPIKESSASQHMLDDATELTSATPIPVPSEFHPWLKMTIETQDEAIPESFASQDVPYKSTEPKEAPPTPVRGSFFPQFLATLVILGGIIVVLILHSSVTPYKNTATVIPTLQPNSTEKPRSTPTPTLLPGIVPTPTLLPGTTPSPTLLPGATPTPTLLPGTTPTPTLLPGTTPTPTLLPGVTPTSTPLPGVTPTPTPFPGVPMMSISPHIINKSFCVVGSQPMTVTNSGGGILQWNAQSDNNAFGVNPFSGSVSAGGSETISFILDSLGTSGKVTFTSNGNTAVVTVHC